MSEFEARLKTAVDSALFNLRADFDIERPDIRLEEAAWNRIHFELCSLIVKAYDRNHSRD